ncbi:response regulator [Fodinicurvata sp. EGI_FJ10296]|uniref:response regulator n=1 Tax=Fodinicurvata sp. EGI_FJ10296 TaxID=3231908 RepID=UPI003453BA3B
MSSPDIQAKDRDSGVEFFSLEVRQVVTHQLVDLCYQIIEAENAAAAVRIIESDEQIDLLFTDIVMPGGKTGIDLAREARRHRPTLKVIFTSGFADIHNGEKDEATVLGPLLCKPYCRCDLACQIMAALQGSKIS